ncbi:hypothetical protein QBC40DRAFT_323091 [Triangularia verruculosa]|uniref:Uncharacterized protein n=1 Tax=Triangularia verruculosa TaxID=2587418 RepID=A0AAN7AZC6_9PEZI|nr:hypothetical protein QBC40DRAFT_323091 [Triangularia verruculosa]
MIGKDDPGAGAVPFKDHPSPEGSAAIVPPMSTPKRSITPKGTLFTNLGDAHLAITARVAAKKAGQVVPATPVNAPRELPIEPLDEPHPKDGLPLASHMELVKSSHIVNGRCLTGYSPNPPISRDRHEAPSQPASSSPSAETIPSSPYENFNPDLDWVHGPGPEICSKRRPRETGSTVENIYRQYLPSEPSTVEHRSVAQSSPPINTNHPQSPVSGNGDNNGDHYVLAHSLTPPSPKSNHANDGANPGKQRRKLYDTAGDAPSIPLPELPTTQRSTQYYQSANSHLQEHDDPPTPSGMSHSNTQVLLDRYSDDSQLAHYEGFSEEHVVVGDSPSDALADAELQPSQHHAHEQLRQRLDRLHYACNAGLAEFSTGALTSESDEDPFKYDRKSYNAFLQPVREREVSMALQQLTGTGSAPLEENNNPTNPFASPTQLLPESGQRGMQSRNPYLNRLQAYKAPESEDAWEDQDDPNEVKIPVQRPASFAPAPLPEPPAQNLDLTEDWRGSFYNDNFHQVQSDRGDWETVGTNVGGQFGSNLACASGTGLSGSQNIKVTGSSIADYSDCSSFGPSPYDAFTSTERILQHPADDMKPSNQLFRNIKDTGRPVFLPKPRVPRANGYPLDSVRHFTDTATTASDKTARSALLEKINARLRRTKEQQNRENPFQVLPNSSVPQLSDVYELEDMSHNMHAANEGVGPSGLHKDNRLTPQNQEPISMAKESPTLFSFPLITLQEAVKKQAIKRASGEDDMTLTTTRTRQDSSVLSSRATQRTSPPTPCIAKPQRQTPPTPCLPKPPPTHLRRPTGLGIPATATPYPAYRMDKGFDGHGRNLSIVSPLSSGSPPIYGRAVFARSCRNPFGDVRADRPRNSTRSSFGFPVMLRRSTHKTKTTREKRDILRQTAHVPTPPTPAPIVDPETAGAFVLSSDDAYISSDNQRKRRLFYYGALAMCIFPFLTLLVYHGAFDPLLVWWTEGEVRRMTRRQRHVVGIVGSTVAAVWLAAIAVVVTLLVSAKA